MLRATIFKNGCDKNGKVVKVGSSMDELLENIKASFKDGHYTNVFTSFGAEINDVSLIRDDEVLYASKGENFIPISSTVVVPKCSCGTITQSQNPESGCPNDFLRLNVGGTIFCTSATTLLNREPNSVLARMFDPASNMKPSCMDSSGAYLLDRDPKYFSVLLNYLRSGSLILDAGINPKGVLEEASYFGVTSCMEDLEKMIIAKDEQPLSRRDVIDALIRTPNKSALRFQGVNLNETDLSYLDLRNINFKYAKLRKAKLSYCNLSFCNFERADMTGVEMCCAVLSGVRMACAIMEGAVCVNCNFQDPSGNTTANMEGVNLRNSNLEDSDLSGANLRVANLKNANLKATTLRGTILAGADLAMSDLTGSDLQEANLRGANLKDAALELMINPLHMSQAIR